LIREKREVRGIAAFSAASVLRRCETMQASLSARRRRRAL
jgi:hypothetical protein